MGQKRKRQQQLTKVDDEENSIRCASGSYAKVRFEAWEDAQGRTVKYAFALIHHPVCQVDNGRVLGYDNAHGFHERHFMGQASRFPFVSFTDTQQRFSEELEQFRKDH